MVDLQDRAGRSNPSALVADAVVNLSVARDYIAAETAVHTPGAVVKQGKVESTTSQERVCLFCSHCLLLYAHQRILVCSA